MTVTMDEFEEFMEVFENQDIKKVDDSDLRKAIRHFWNVASQPTVEDRIQTLKGEGWIEKVPHASAWELNYDKSEGIEQVFREKGQ